MKLGIISDIHLEFRSDYFRDSVIDEINSCSEVDFVIIAGDIDADQERRQTFLNQLSVPFKYVLGNHDHYGNHLTSHRFDENGIVGATLWTNFGNDQFIKNMSGKRINDFRHIKGFTADVCESLFYDEFKFLMQSQSEIVVSHFPPSMRSVTEQYRGDLLNPYFCNDLDDFIMNSNKKLWIHGHVHSNHDYTIGDCRVVSNVVGYPNELKTPFEMKIVEI